VTNNSTCWTVIAGAAAGNREDREQFARRYESVVRAYLSARWRNGPCLTNLDDAAQEVFVECLKPGGVLECLPSDLAGGFRSFLYGVVRNVARHFETRLDRERCRSASSDHDLGQVPDSEESLSRMFDRVWAQGLMREAAQRQAELAELLGPDAVRRVELLRLRFHEGLPIRDVAQRWQVDAAKLHHEYARARQEFKAALMEVVAFHHPGSAEEVAHECANLQSQLG
jgi:RNA polymerase sigma-70 factor (ECF subfamily)